MQQGRDAHRPTASRLGVTPLPPHISTSIRGFFLEKRTFQLFQAGRACAKFKGFAYPTAPQMLVDTNLPDCQCAHIDYSATRSHQQYHLILV